MNALEENPDECIDLIGHSRGGLVALMVAERLEALGIQIRFMGLYDPVDHAFGPTIRNGVPSNVGLGAIIYSDTWSRWYFNRINRGRDKPNVRYAYFSGSHGTLGAEPWSGDSRLRCPSKFSGPMSWRRELREEYEAWRQSRRFIRGHAEDVGISFHDAPPDREIRIMEFGRQQLEREVPSGWFPSDIIPRSLIP